MEKVIYWLTAGFLLSLSLLNTVLCQQNAIFNQSPFQRRQQTAFLRQQQQQLQQQQQQQQQQSFPGSPFAPISPLTTLNSISPISPIIPQTAYRTYNQVNPHNFVPITAYQNDLNYDGSFAYGYSTADGTTAQAQGYVKNLGLGEAVEAQVVQGSYSYTSPEGTPITVRYIADENGFRAEGAHIPTPPPIPEAIAKSLQYISSQQQQQPFQSGGISLNPNLNPYQTPFRQFNPTQTVRLGTQQQQQQLTPLQLQQQQRYYQQQNSGQYQPEGQFNSQQQQQQQFGLGSNSAIGQKFGFNFQQQQQQGENFPQNLNLTTQPQQNPLTQQQNEQQQQQHNSQLPTQQLHGRPSQLVNHYGHNHYRRFKKASSP